MDCTGEAELVAELVSRTTEPPPAMREVLSNLAGIKAALVRMKVAGPHSPEDVAHYQVRPPSAACDSSNVTRTATSNTPPPPPSPLLTPQPAVPQPLQPTQPTTAPVRALSALVALRPPPLPPPLPVPPNQCHNQYYQIQAVQNPSTALARTNEGGYLYQYNNHPSELPPASNGTLTTAPTRSRSPVLLINNLHHGGLHVSPAQESQPSFCSVVLGRLEGEQ